MPVRDVNAVDFAGFTPLIHAAANRNLDAVRLLLAKGADVECAVRRRVVSKSEGGHDCARPLDAADGVPSRWRSPELVKTLLDAGANVNVPDVRGMTPLMLAVATDRQNIDVDSHADRARRRREREEPGGGDGARLGRQDGSEARDRRDQGRGRSGDGARAGLPFQPPRTPTSGRRSSAAGRCSARRAWWSPRTAGARRATLTTSSTPSSTSPSRKGCTLTRS